MPRSKVKSQMKVESQCCFSSRLSIAFKCVVCNSVIDWDNLKLCETCNIRAHIECFYAEHDAVVEAAKDLGFEEDALGCKSCGGMLPFLRDDCDVDAPEEVVAAKDGPGSYKNLMSLQPELTNYIKYMKLKTTGLEIRSRPFSLEAHLRAEFKAKKDSLSKRLPVKNGSSKPEYPLFDNFNQAAIYAIKAIKRIVTTCNGDVSLNEHLLKELVNILEFNIESLKLDKKLFFGTLRDYSRVLHEEWFSFVPDFNSLLIIVAIRLGLEKLFSPHGYNTLSKNIIAEGASCIFPTGDPVFNLKELDQSDPLFDYFASNSPYLEKIKLSLSDNDSFMRLCKFKSLRIIELASGVSDKVICNALWNVGSKKSDKILELALTKDLKSWQLTLPNLEVLRYNVIRHDAQVKPMRLTLGAAALAIQPKMNEVSSAQVWGNFEAIVHLLDMDDKRKTSGNRRQLAVTVLTINYKGLNLADVPRVVKSCPKLKCLHLRNTKGINPDLSYLSCVLPVEELISLTLDATALTNVELTVLVSCMKKLESLTLKVTPHSIASYNIPRAPYNMKEVKPETFKSATQIPLSIKKLVIEFVSGKGIDNYDPRTDGRMASIITFLGAFPTTKEIYFRNTILLDPKELIYGCLSGAIASLLEVRHVSIVAASEDISAWMDDIISCKQDTACNEDISAWVNGMISHKDDVSAKDDPLSFLLGYPKILSCHRHCNEIKKTLPGLEDDATFKYLEKLESMEIDGLYVSEEFDPVIRALRLSGVLITVFYRTVQGLPMI